MIHADLAKASQQLGIELPAIEKAANVSIELIKNFEKELNKILEDTIREEHKADLCKTDVVILGSIARQESGAASDFDYYILQNGAHPEVTRDLMGAARTILDNKSEMKNPGGRGVFDRIVVAPNR